MPGLLLIIFEFEAANLGEMQGFAKNREEAKKTENKDEAAEASKPKIKNKREIYNLVSKYFCY